MRTPAVAVAQRNDILRLRMELGKQNCRLVRLGPAICEKRFLQAPWSDLGQLFSQADMRLGRVER